jgi:phosphate transport system protein
VTDAFPLDQHISRDYNAEIVALRRRLLTMGGLVEKHIADALAVLRDGDSALAERLNQSDQEVNACEVEIDEAANHILARRQPAASDLRLVFTILKTSTDLERVGDEAAKIARLFLTIPVQEREVSRLKDLLRLGEAVQDMMHRTLDALARFDAVQALAVSREDHRIDADYEAFLRQSITYMMEDPRSIRRFLNAIWIARAIERMGDHAKNICEYIIYFVYGKDVRHTSPEQMARIVDAEAESPSSRPEPPP